MVVWEAAHQTTPPGRGLVDHWMLIRVYDRRIRAGLGLLYSDGRCVRLRNRSLISQWVLRTSTTTKGT
eukprot:1671571-Pyramimonas_sp.AAC.1